MKFRKTAATFLLSTLFLTTLGSSASAVPAAKPYTEQELNRILINAGVPVTVLSQMDFENKRFIVKNSGENLKFKGSHLSKFEHNQDGSFTTLGAPSNGVSIEGTIPTSDMDLSTYVFYNSSNSSMYDVYSSFEWNKLYDIDNDHIGIAVPEQWVIQSGSYTSETYYQTIYLHNSGLGWVSWDASGGRPYQIDLYGADWNYNTPIGINGEDPGNMYWKGTVKYTMKSSGSAQNRVVSKYASVTGGWGSAAIEVGIGPATVQYSPPSGW
jgi:hypothetical protein